MFLKVGDDKRAGSLNKFTQVRRERDESSINELMAKLSNFNKKMLRTSCQASTALKLNRGTKDERSFAMKIFM